MKTENNITSLSEIILRITLTQALYECGVREDQIIDQLCRHCHSALDEAISILLYEKTTRAPIRELQKYLEAEKGFPPDSKKSVYGLAFFKMNMTPEIRGASPE